MNESWVLLKRGALLAVAVVAGTGILLGVFTLVWPWMLPAFENLTGRYLWPEGNVRLACFLIVLAGAGIAGVLWHGFGNVHFRRLGALLLVALIVLLPIFLWDPTRVKDEESWIRWPTALFLLLASLEIWLIARRYNHGERWPTAPEWSWLLLSFGLLFAAFDELFTIHETIGGYLERGFKLSHITTDFITMLYGLIGIGALLLAYRLLRPVLATIPKVFLAVMWAGLLLFVIATAFDTFDTLVVRILNFVTKTWYDGGHIPLPQFFDLWYSPLLLLNSIEEVFEMLAAMLFAYAAFTVLWPVSVEQVRMGRRVRWTVTSLALGCIAVIVPTFFLSAAWKATTPFADGTKAEAIAAAPEGLYHTDDLSYDSEKGVFVANESRPDWKKLHNGPGVFQYRDEVFSRLPDPDNHLLDTDSIAVVDGAVYAAASGLGTIYRFNEQAKKFEKFSDRAQGLSVPEAIASHEGKLYVLDEHEKGIAIVAADGSVTTERPQHPLWSGPEDLLYVDALDGFLLTDDKSGVIFLYKPGQPVTLWADKNVGLIHPEGIARYDAESFVITDNGLGQIIRFDFKGNVLNRWTVRWLYRDTQGITVDKDKNIYFVTADGFAGVSFMPSVLWKFTPTLESDSYMK